VFLINGVYLVILIRAFLLLFLCVLMGCATSSLDHVETSMAVDENSAELVYSTLNTNRESDSYRLLDPAECRKRVWVGYIRETKSTDFPRSKERSNKKVSTYSARVKAGVPVTLRYHTATRKESCEQSVSVILEKGEKYRLSGEKIYNGFLPVFVSCKMRVKNISDGQAVPLLAPKVGVHYTKCNEGEVVN
jgi:hypothetical protein